MAMLILGCQVACGNAWASLKKSSKNQANGHTYIQCIALHWIAFHYVAFHYIHYIDSRQYITYIILQTLHHITLPYTTWHLHLHYSTLYTLHYVTLHFVTKHNITWHYVTYITLHAIITSHITRHYITLHTWHDMRWHDITWHYIAVRCVTQKRTYIHTCIRIHTYVRTEHTHMYIRHT